MKPYYNIPKDRLTSVKMIQRNIYITTIMPTNITQVGLPINIT